MQRKKSRLELLYSPYLNTAEIKRLLAVPRSVAERYYKWADELDNEQLGQYRGYPTKVRKESALKVAGKSFSALERDIKNADALAQQSANNQ